MDIAENWEEYKLQYQSEERLRHQAQPPHLRWTNQAQYYGQQQQQQQQQQPRQTIAASTSSNNPFRQTPAQGRAQAPCDPNAMNVDRTGRRKGRPVCYRCGQPGHFSNACPNSKASINAIINAALAEERAAAQLPVSGTASQIVAPTPLLSLPPSTAKIEEVVVGFP